MADVLVSFNINAFIFTTKDGTKDCVHLNSLAATSESDAFANDPANGSEICLCLRRKNNIFVAPQAD